MVVDLALLFDDTSEVRIEPRDEASQAWLATNEITLDTPLGRVRRRLLHCHFGLRQAKEAAALLEAEVEGQDRDRERHGYPRAADGYRVRAGRYVTRNMTTREDGTVIREQEFVEI